MASPKGFILHRIRYGEYQDVLKTRRIEAETWEQNGQMNIMDFLA